MYVCLYFLSWFCLLYTGRCWEDQPLLNCLKKKQNQAESAHIIRARVDVTKWRAVLYKKEIKVFCQNAF